MIVIYCSAPIERADSAIQSLSDRYEYIISYIYKSDQRWSFFVCLWSKGIKGVGDFPLLLDIYSYGIHLHFYVISTEYLHFHVINLLRNGSIIH